MADLAHTATDTILEEMEQHLTEIYDRAAKEIEKKAKSFWKRYEKADAEKKKAVEAGKLSEKEWQIWRKDRLMAGRKWNQLKKQISEQLLHVHETAAAYINGELPNVFALNYNSVGDYLETRIRGYSFDLVDAETVKNLATSKKGLLPYKSPGVKEYIRWDTTHINAEILQGILQGQSIPKIATRLKRVAEMDKHAAIRTARTAITSAENKGRINAMQKAKQDGIIMKKVWISTNDKRTRYAHKELNGTEAEVDEAFESEFGKIRYPGDPEAHPCNVYNCRCTLGTKLIGFQKKERK